MTLPMATMSDSTIMAVDDEPVNLKLLERTLGHAGYSNIVLIQDPRDVLDKYNEKRPDIILLDINMPYLNGFDVMQQLQALDDPLLPPIVVLTAQQGHDFLVKSLEHGASDYVCKPFERTELLMRVRNFISAHLQHIAVYNQKQTLEKLVQQRTQELHATRLQVVQRLGQAAEYRDEETGNHILRMSHSCQIIAREIGWSERDCDLILNASPMHDIGKIGIPDNILLKPGKFEPEEWEIMKTHATIGAKLLEGDDSDLMLMAREIALGHHEKWDGSGYPSGLAGEEIPESARIAAICDVFDALTSVRPYKKAWPLEDATQLLVDNKGKHFEPRLVDVFMDNLDDILAIRERYSDD